MPFTKKYALGKTPFAKDAKEYTKEELEELDLHF